MAAEIPPSASRIRRIWRWLYLGFATALGGLGAVMAVLGVWLISLGGSFYYFLAGIGLVAGTILAWRARHRAALGVFGAVVAATVIWSLVEIAGKGWLPAWGIDFAGRTAFPQRSLRRLRPKLSVVASAASLPPPA